jgi:diketogulonate reductase-like aldo/keto reductase
MITIPHKTFFNGDKMPVVGLGTFGSDKYGPAEVAAAVIEAAEVGYRHFDCASVYGNEPEIGHSLTTIQNSGVDRKGLWITSKVWNDKHDQVEASCEQSLRDLKLDYLDLYLVHWPFPNSHAPGVSVDSRDPHAVPFNLDRFMETWAQMERLTMRGLVRHIGTSNMTVSKLEGLIRLAAIKPAVNELELHPHFQQKQLFQFLVENEIVPIGYCPIGSPSRPERDRTPEDTVDVEDPVIAAAAERLGVHPAVVCVLWQVQLGSVPIPFSVKRSQFESTLKSVAELKLTAEEMAAIAGVDQGSRLIKGQVFLWEGAADWRDLWY